MCLPNFGTRLAFKLSQNWNFLGVPDSMTLLPLLNMILQVENPGKAVLALVGALILHSLTRISRMLGFKIRAVNFVPEEK